METLAERFEAQRGQLRAIATRMLGSGGDAEDAVQEVWLRLSRVDSSEVRNLPGWLRTVLSRVCLDMLRARREEPVAELPDGDAGADPARDAALADSVGRALLVVLDRLGPAERVAFVLHDLFAVPFDEIASIVDRSPATAKKLASRARQRVRGEGEPAEASAAEIARNAAVVRAFLAACRDGDLDGLLAVFAPDVHRRADPSVLPAGAPRQTRGARRVAEETVVLGRAARYAEPVMVNGALGAVVVPAGRLALVLTFDISGERIAGFEVIADPDRLRNLRLTLLS